MAYQFASARELFDAAREAARDAEIVRRQLDRIEGTSLSLGGSGFEPRVRSTPDPDRIARAVASSVDVGGRLAARQEEDYRLIDFACSVLYGTDSDAGLWALVGWPADAIYHHYLALRTWEETASLIGYSVRHVYDRVRVAFDIADANGVMWTQLGRGLAED